MGVKRINIYSLSLDGAGSESLNHTELLIIDKNQPFFIYRKNEKYRGNREIDSGGPQE